MSLGDLCLQVFFVHFIAAAPFALDGVVVKVGVVVNHLFYQLSLLAIVSTGDLYHFALFMHGTLTS
jgi:hypothetical protein